MVATTTPEGTRAAGCWTDDFLLGHCEGYWVDAESGDHTGVVDRVVWSEDGVEPVALLVRPTSGWRELVVPVERVERIEPWRRIVVPPDVATRLGS